MSVCNADDSHSTTNLYALHISSHPNETTYRKAVNDIRSNIKNALRRWVHIYSFNVHSEQLESAHALLDKEEERKSMRVTYSDDHNFIVRYMPGPVHKEAHVSWDHALLFALAQLTPPLHSLPPGCKGIAATTFQLGLRKKQADAGVRPTTSHLPSIVLEVGDSESLAQLKIDSRLWLEHMHEVSQFLPLSSKNHLQLWRGFAPLHPPCSPAARQREACMVWAADWTHAATPLYILLSDIFRGQVPAAYGNNDCVQLDTVTWRQDIIDTW
ncbi:hypothetical protein L208DRAFT_1424622 [Tricholoma matsutake]|nr:hypothetical protein L208DRAFT_1424622 [Tricholoma matsutake 945]